MKKAIIKNISTGITKNCDILSKNDNFLEVVLEGTTIKITLKKKKKRFSVFEVLHSLQFTQTFG